MPTLTDVLVVAHTHWDREWYHTVDEFRLGLVRLIDDLLDAPPEPGKAFLLDGQAIVLEDYLAVRPERASDVAAVLRDGRIEAGPWYVLGDELIPGGEAQVRNLLIGRETVRRLRGRTPPVLYCPDSFGHPATLPALAHGFGCALIVLWRGLGGRRWPSGDTMWWRAPDGTRVLVHHLPPQGYELGNTLPIADVPERWRQLRDVLAPRARTGVSLLLSGADHHARQRDQSAVIEALSESAAPVRVRHLSLTAAAAEIVEATSHASLDEIQGELRDSYGYTWTLGGTLSSRAAQKRGNAHAERLFVRDTEPWLVLGHADAAARALLQAAWRTLLQAHPHDTLCGTSIDEVAAAMDARLRSAREQGSSLRTEALHRLVGHDVEIARSAPERWKPCVVVRNSAARERGGIVELALTTKLADVAVGPGSALRQGAAQKARRFGITGVPLQVLSRREAYELTESPRAYPDADRVEQLTAVGWLPSMPGYSVRTFLEGAAPNSRKVPSPVEGKGFGLDNGRLHVEVSELGEVSITDHESGRVVRDVVRFERYADFGDLYTPAIREALPPPAFSRRRLVHRGPLRGAIDAEFRLQGRAGGRCRVAIELDANASFVRFVLRGDNREQDQRLRVVFATGVDGGSTIADAAFGPVRREPFTISSEDDDMERVVPTAPLHRWVVRWNGDTGGVVLVSDGLAEYESMDDGRVAVTLVRSVGELSRPNLRERPGHAGWPAATPAAQSIGPYEAKFTIRFLSGGAELPVGDIESLADDVLLPLVGASLRSNLSDPVSAGGLELIGDGLAFSAAMPAAEPGWMVLRCVNLRDVVVQGAWRVGNGVGEAVLARLDGTRLSPLEITDDTIGFSAGPREIVTILAR